MSLFTDNQILTCKKNLSVNNVNQQSPAKIDFEYLFDLSPNLVFILDLDHNIIRANESFSRLAGLSPESLSGSKCFWCVHKTNKPPHRCIHSLLLNDGKSHTSEVFIEHLKGWYALSVTPILDREGKITGSLHTAHEITSMKLLTKAIEENEARFRDITFSMADWVWEVDTNGVYTYSSEKGSAFLGASRGDIIGKTPFDFMKPEEANRVGAIFSEILLNKSRIKDLENWNIGKNGEEICLLTNGVPILDEEGNLKGYRGVDKDITRRKRSEKELRQKNEELEKINAEKDKFFSIIAHDLLSPFNVFLNYTRILEDDLQKLTHKQIEMFVHMMGISANNLFCLLKNLLEWTRMQMGMIAFQPESVSLLEHFEENSRLAMEYAGKKNIEIVLSIHPDLMVFADPNMLGSILRNLVTNAVKFTPKEGKVVIAANSTGQGVVEVSIMDNGIGMNDDMVQNLFRMDIDTGRPGTEHEPSTGLGLFLCKDFAEKNGGKIRVESEEGKGSTFYFTVPAKI